MRVVNLLFNETKLSMLPTIILRCYFSVRSFFDGVVEKLVLRSHIGLTTLRAHARPVLHGQFHSSVIFRKNKKICVVLFLWILTNENWKAITTNLDNDLYVNKLII